MEPQRRKQKNWLGLMIGNSRLHWAQFVGKTLEKAWDTDHLSTIPNSLFPIPISQSIYLASVVPEQTVLWQAYTDVRVITLDQLPLEGVYPTLGIDRALAVLGAGEVWGLPVLVIDAGTALTFTGADANRRLVGGAILPGLRLQLNSLAQKTAALPKIELPDKLAPRFARNTPQAIQSGVIYTVLAGIKDFIQAWWQDFPESKIILTGGDRAILLSYLQTQFPEIGNHVITDPNIIFLGMRSVVSSY